jgi:hypothetical protein
MRCNRGLAGGDVALAELGPRQDLPGLDSSLYVPYHGTINEQPSRRIPAMDTMELAQRAIAELAPLGDGLGLRAAMQAAENDKLAPHMLSALLGHELVAGHATMIKLSTKVDRWLALVADDRAPADQERGSREAVRLAIAAARLSDRYRVGLVSLAKLRGWEGFRKGRAAAARGAEADDLAAAAEIAAALIGDGDGLDEGPHDDPNGGGPKGGARAAAKALQQLQALRGRYGNGPTNGHANSHTQNSPSHFGRGSGGGLGAGSDSSSANSNRGKLRHGNPSGDFLAAPRCGAQTRAGCPCRQPAMANGRCRMHGGKSTGARTEAGLARVRANRLVHGARTAEIIDLRSAAARHGRALRSLARLTRASAAADPQSDQSIPCVGATGRSPAPRCASVAGRAVGETGDLPVAPTDPRFERSTPCPATTPANPSRRLVHAETRRRGLSDALHLRVSAPPRGILPFQRTTPSPATSAPPLPQRLRMAAR